MIFLQKGDFVYKNEGNNKRDEKSFYSLESKFYEGKGYLKYEELNPFVLSSFVFNGFCFVLVITF